MGASGTDDRGLQEREPLPRVDGRRHHRQQEEEGGARGGKGASIKYVRKIFGFLDPLPPLSALL